MDFEISLNVLETKLAAKIAEEEGADKELIQALVVIGLDFIQAVHCIAVNLERQSQLAKYPGKTTPEAD